MSYDRNTGKGKYTVNEANVVVTIVHVVVKPDGVSAMRRGKTVEDGDIVAKGAELVADSEDSEGNPAAALNATQWAESPAAVTTGWVVDQAGNQVISVAGLMVSYDTTKASMLKPNAAGDAGDRRLFRMVRSCRWGLSSSSRRWRVVCMRRQRVLGG